MQIDVTEHAQTEEEAVFAEIRGRYIKERDETIAARLKTGHEPHWKNARDQYDGIDTEKSSSPNAPSGMDMKRAPGGVVFESSGSGNAPKSLRSNVVLNITADKTDSVVAFLAMLKYPTTGERSFNFDPTPVPEMEEKRKQVGDVVLAQNGAPIQKPDGTQMTGGDVFDNIEGKAKKAAQLMEKEIEDNLVECRFEDEDLCAIDDMAMYGMGVIRGPFKKRILKSGGWKAQSVDGKRVYEEMTEDVDIPAAEHVPLVDFFPAIGYGGATENLPFVYIRKKVNASDLLELASSEWAKPEEILEVLKEGPDKSSAQDRSSDDKQFSLWMRTGKVSISDMMGCGCVAADDYKDELTGVPSVVYMVNDRLIGVHVDPMADFRRFKQPYHIYYLRKPPSGEILTHAGIPFIMRNSQNAAKSAWRMVLDNGALSTGGQIVVDDNIVEPINGVWELHANKVWRWTGAAGDAPPFKVFDIPTRQQELSAILTMAMQFADQEVGFYRVNQGQQDVHEQTAAEATLRSNASNQKNTFTLKKMDIAFVNMLHQFYAWHMMHNEKDEIKGDYCIKITGTSSRFEDAQKAQVLQQWLAAIDNPRIGYMIDEELLVKQLAGKSHIFDILKSDDAIAKAKIEMQERAKNAPPIPQVAAAQIRAKSEIEKAQLLAQERAQERQQEAAFDTKELELDAARLELEKATHFENVKKESAFKVMDINTRREDREREIAVESPSPRLA